MRSSPCTSPTTSSSLTAAPRPRPNSRMRPTVVAQSAAAEAPGQQQVQQQVAEWLRLDKDAASRAQVQALLDRQAHTELQELMCQRLEFGACSRGLFLQCVLSFWVRLELWPPAPGLKLQRQFEPASAFVYC
jgi:hypothetical protein